MPKYVRSDRGVTSGDLSGGEGPSVPTIQSFSTGAYRSSSRLTPWEPKSMDATALSPTPSSATTLPIPNESCTTRSPGASDGTARLVAFASASARIAAVPNRRVGGPALRAGRDGSTGRFHDV